MFMQTLMQNLTNQKIWYVDYKIQESNDQLKFLFFTLKILQKMLVDYYKIILMNCIYKTNKYKMLLLIIIKVIVLNIIFYVAFCFMKDENYNDYIWVMQTLKWLYNHLDLSYSETVLFNNDKMLTSALHHVFSDSEYHVNHALCMWHMNNNIIINCKKFFSINKLYDEFMKKWKTFCMMKIFALLNEDYNVFYHIYLDVDVMSLHRANHMSVF